MQWLAGSSGEGSDRNQWLAGSSGEGSDCAQTFVRYVGVSKSVLGFRFWVSRPDGGAEIVRIGVSNNVLCFMF